MQWKGTPAVFLLLSLLTAFSLLPGISRATETDYLNITLNITAEVSIDVDPDTLFIQASVGETTGFYPQNGVGVRIINVGSLDIANIRANISMASSNPFGSGDPLNYNAGDYIQMNASTNETFRWINSIHWNETKPGNVVPPIGWIEGHNTGYYIQVRTASDDDEGVTYHAITNSSDGQNCSDDTGTNDPFIRISKLPKNVTDDPDYDLSDATNYTEVTLSYTQNSAGTPYGAGKIDSHQDLGSYCILVSEDCASLILYHFGRDWDFSGTDCDADQYVFTGTLQPGQSTSTWYRAKVPFGVEQGRLGYGILWFTATAA